MGQDTRPAPRPDGAIVAPRARDIYAAIEASPSYAALLQSRNNLAQVLTVAILVIYIGFILLVAFGKQLLATKIGGGTTSFGIVLGLAVIVSAFVLVAIYVVRANGKFDDLTNQIRQEVGQ